MIIYLTSFTRLHIKIRRLNKFSQLYICAIISMEKSNLSSIENGRQNSTTLTLKGIADAIDVEVKVFLF